MILNIWSGISPKKELAFRAKWSYFFKAFVSPIVIQNIVWTQSPEIFQRIHGMQIFLNIDITFLDFNLQDLFQNNELRFIFYSVSNHWAPFLIHNSTSNCSRGSFLWKSKINNKIVNKQLIFFYTKSKFINKGVLLFLHYFFIITLKESRNRQTSLPTSSMVNNLFFKVTYTLIMGLFWGW